MYDILMQAFDIINEELDIIMLKTYKYKLLSESDLLIVLLADIFITKKLQQKNKIPDWFIITLQKTTELLEAEYSMDTFKHDQGVSQLVHRSLKQG